MMHKLNAVLLMAVVALSLVVVTLQHQARRTYSELEKVQQKGELLEVEYRKLQLEQSTWGAHSVVEKAATGRFNMHIPDQHEVQALVLREEGSGEH